MDGKGRAKNGDLTRVGSKPCDVEWHIAHLKDPASKVPGSKMPAYDDKTARRTARLSDLHGQQEVNGIFTAEDAEKAEKTEIK